MISNDNSQHVIEVVGGIIRRGDKYLLGKRPLGKSQGGHWEFIGGKIEPGETPEQALARECMEEIALPIVNAKVRTAVTHAYPDRTIHLTLIDCESAPGAEPTALEHSELGWFTPQEMKGLDFCAADAALAPMLFAEESKTDGETFNMSVADAVREVLRKIVKRSKDNGRIFTDESRLKAIRNCLAGSDWSPFAEMPLAKIWAHERFDPTKPAVVISSHIDMVAENCYADCSSAVWKGSFDNLITNAVVVALMLRKELGAQVLVAFTGDEENDSLGADQTVRVLLAKGAEIKFVIVTDVTEEGYEAGKSFSLENIFPEDADDQNRIIGQFRPALEEIDAHPQIIRNGDQDEAWEYDEFDLSCCSMCIPCSGDMHSEDGVEVRVADIGSYAAALAACVRVLNSIN